jgi:pimeloyl-ACP methyl ester carboxylesterase
LIIPGGSVTPSTDTAIRTVSRRALICAGLVAIAGGPGGSAHALEPWEALPPTPRLPPAQWSGTVAVNGAHIWRAAFGAGDDVVMLHGGLAHSDYWGLQAAALAQRRRVLVIDSRGHGRSDNANGQPFSYRQMADDVIAVMDQLKIAKAAIVGWSDGAIIGLEIAMRFPERVDRLFAFAANYNPEGLRDVGESAVFQAFIARAAGEYRARSPTPDGFAVLRAGVERMWATQPRYSESALRRIMTPVLVVDGDHDEAIRPEHTRALAALLPNARLLIEPGVSHFAFLQASERFTAALEAFLTA